jgi:predicted ester cyclase
MSCGSLERVRAWVEQIWNQGQLEQMAHFHPPTLLNEGEASTLQAMQEWHKRNRATFPDIRYEILDIFGTQDRVAFRWQATATQRGTLWGMIPPTNRAMTWRGVHLVRLQQDKIVEIWALEDSVSMLQQMGVKLQPAGGSDDD